MTHLTIAHVLSSFGMGGQERVALDLARQQRAQGHRVVALALAEPPAGPMAALFEAADVPTSTITKLGPSFDPTLSVRLARVLTQHHVDVVHTHNPHALVYGSPAAVLCTAACLHTKHGVNPDPARRLWVRRAAAKVLDAFVAVTPRLARVATSNHECDPTQLHVVPNGIDTQLFSLDLEARRRVRAELGIPDQAWVVGSVGRLAPEKHQSLLIDAMAPMLEPRRHLVLVGDGPERPALLARAQATLRPELIHFTGARSDVTALLSAFDVFALTSDSEGLPLVLLEAMAMGLPVVSTSVGGIPDLVEHERTGFLVDPDNQNELTRRLIWLSTRPQTALDAASAGRRLVVQRHCIERMAGDYERLYARVARPRAQPVLATNS